MKCIVALAVLLFSIHGLADETPQTRIAAALPSATLETLVPLLQENGDMMPVDDPVWESVLIRIIELSEMDTYAHPAACSGDFNEPLQLALLQYTTRSYPENMPFTEREALTLSGRFDIYPQLSLIVAWARLQAEDEIESQLTTIVNTCLGQQQPIGNDVWREIKNAGIEARLCDLLRPETIGASFYANQPKVVREITEAIDQCWTPNAKLNWGVDMLKALSPAKGYFSISEDSALTGSAIETFMSGQFNRTYLHNWLLQPSTQASFIGLPLYQELKQRAVGDWAFFLWANELDQVQTLPENWAKYCEIDDPYIQKAIAQLLNKHQASCPRLQGL